MTEEKTDTAVRTFITGSIRDAAEGKGRYDLISPFALARLAHHYERGSVHYGDRNWERGQPYSVVLDSAMRHIQKRMMGLRDEDHVAAAAWNLFALMHYEHQVAAGGLPEELADLPVYEIGSSSGC
ncbi:MAG TPA: dATP/dGTP diphosphohydrolase domain-containing protein [Longimicrobiales bacterium]|nr:dATP/dGTP diphosphohydrolase domain-containing protein [Longimicrobiales bacterium]